MNRLLLAAFVTSILAAGAAPAAADSTARVYGQLHAGDTSQGAIVTISDEAGRTVKISTDHEGRFAAIGLEPGRLTVSVQARVLVSDGIACTVPSGETGRFDFFAVLTNDRFDSTDNRPTPKQDESRCGLEPSTTDRYVIR